MWIETKRGSQANKKLVCPMTNVLNRRLKVVLVSTFPLVWWCGDWCLGLKITLTKPNLVKVEVWAQLSKITTEKAIMLKLEGCNCIVVAYPIHTKISSLLIIFNNLNF